MQAKKILFATDFSDASETALGVAASLARASGAELIIAHVEAPPLAYGGEEMLNAVFEPPSPLAAEQLARVVPADASVPHRHVLLMGSPSEEIIELARQEAADMLVIGSHGRTGLYRLLMGSIAEALLRKAPCPVLTVKVKSGVA